MENNEQLTLFEISTDINDLKVRKQWLLDQLKSKNKNSINKYKRVNLSPIRYAGGKSLAVGHIIELLPTTINRVISPFFGGGSVELAINKYLGLKVIGGDIFDILVNYWNFQINEPELLYAELSKLKPNKDTFNYVKMKLTKHWKGEERLDNLTLAVFFFFNFNLSYGPGFLGWPSKVYLNEKRYIKMIEKVRNFKYKNIKVECADFQVMFKKYPNDFFYCDPPYYLGGDSKMFKGIYPQRNFPIYHNGFKHEVLHDLLSKHKGGFILSYNNCSTIRAWYKDFEQYFPTWQYTMGQGETRIGKNRIERGTTNNIKRSHEILIFSPPKT